ERFLQILVLITEQAQGAILTEDQRQALEASLRYFRVAAPKHTMDEEESLFPRMRACDNPQAQAALARLDSLHADHLLADELHRQIDAVGTRWLEEGRLSSGRTHRLAEMLDELSDIYRRHIALEDAELFPLAARVLDRDEIEALGREMAQRRGIDPDALEMERSQK
ncbi:MAG TPA: hemerythrin domain-containing protein, partial [Blastocatellia bacterium]|nr:hemerythrin domain-containing protein [Blastocatellia bacterium]